jgi:hypothetical protein
VADRVDAGQAAGDSRGIGNVADDALRAWVEIVRYDGMRRQQGVEHPGLDSRGQQGVDHVRADEPGTAGD